MKNKVEILPTRANNDLISTGQMIRIYFVLNNMVWCRTKTVDRITFIEMVGLEIIEIH